MHVMSIAAVMIAILGTWLAPLFKTYENVTSVSAAAPVSLARNNGWAVGADEAISNKPAFSPLRDDICDDGINDSLLNAGIERKPLLIAAPNAKCGVRQMRDWVDTDE